MSRRLRRTKIVTTLGPATDRDNNLEKVIAAGANVVRMNFSHGSPEDHKMRADKVREIAARLGRHVAILGDLQGPKIRVSTFKEGKVFLNIGDKFLLDANLGKGEGDKEKVGIDYKGLPADVVPGDILLLDDGRVQLKVLEVQGMKVFTEVTVGGPLSNNKGINKLGGGLSAEALTEKDKADIKTAALIGVDYLAVSFPRCGEDLNYARRLARDAGWIRRARQLNRAVITATQMMESMITNPMPTRAEVMDVANAVLDGTDAVMLSAETAAGQYPSETVAAMARVCLGAEKIPSINVSKHRLDVQFDNVEEAIAMSAMYAANHLKGVTAIITMTESGRTALMTSRISSGLPIFAMSRHERTLNLTALYRGVTPVHFDSANDGVAAASEAVNLLRDKGYLMSGDLVIVTQGDVMSTVGSNVYYQP